MIPQSVPPRATDGQLCQLVDRWGITYSLALKLSRMAEQLPFGISIISGARTKESQDQLTRQGRPTADWNRTTHADTDEHGCPRLATGADLRTAVAPVASVQATFGQAATLAGLRWGGSSPVDPNTGIPSDWNHVDEGPRG